MKPFRLIIEVLGLPFVAIQLGHDEAEESVEIPPLVSDFGFAAPLPQPDWEDED